MSRITIPALALLAFGFTLGGAAPAAHAGAAAPLSCTVSVTSTLNKTTVLTYNQTFVVTPDAAYSDDFSTATRFRFFDATMTVENNLPVVAFRLDADISVFDTVDFGTSLKVRDSGETTSGTSSFFTTRSRTRRRSAAHAREP